MLIEQNSDYLTPAESNNISTESMVHILSLFIRQRKAACFHRLLFE